MGSEEAVGRVGGSLEDIFVMVRVLARDGMRLFVWLLVLVLKQIGATVGEGFSAGCGLVLALGSCVSAPALAVRR